MAKPTSPPGWPMRPNDARYPCPSHTTAKATTPTSGVHHRLRAAEPWRHLSQRHHCQASPLVMSQKRTVLPVAKVRESAAPLCTSSSKGISVEDAWVKNLKASPRPRAYTWGVAWASDAVQAICSGRPDHPGGNAVARAADTVNGWAPGYSTALVPSARRRSNSRRWQAWRFGSSMSWFHARSAVWIPGPTISGRWRLKHVWIQRIQSNRSRCVRSNTCSSPRRKRSQNSRAHFSPT